MNVNIMTIGSIFSQPAAPPSAEPRIDASPENSRFSTVHKHSEQPTDVNRQAKPYQAHAETPGEPSPKERKDYREVIEKRTKPDDPDGNRNGYAPTFQNTEPKASCQSEASQGVAVQSHTTVDQNKKEPAEKFKPNARQQLVNLIDSGKGKKAQPATSTSVKSPETRLYGNKTDKTTETKAVTTETLKNIPLTASGKQIGKAESPETSSKTELRATNANQAGSVEALSSDGAAFNNIKKNDPGREKPTAGSSAETASAKDPVKSTEISTDQMPDLSIKKTANDSRIKTVPASDSSPTVKTETSTAPRQAPTVSSVNNTDKTDSTADIPPKGPEKSLPTSENSANPAARRASTQQVRTFGSKIVNSSNNTENAVSTSVEAQTSTDGTQPGDSRSSGDGINQNAARIFSQNTAQTPATEQSATFAVETKVADPSEQPQPTPDNGPVKVGSQVIEAVRNSISQPTGDKEITIQLNPPELGKVSVKFREQGTEITGTLEVSKAQTRAEIEHALPEMIRALADSGIAIKRLEVVLSQNNQPDQQSARGPLFNDGQFNQQNHSNPGQSGEQHHTPQTTYGSSPRGRYQYLNLNAHQEMLVTNSSINMLV